MYYFTHEMKLQLIPYVQKQTILFLEFFQQYIFSLQKQNNQHDNGSQDKFSSQECSQQLNQKIVKLLKILNKRFKQLQQFHYQNWTDYRANLILRSINQIKIFYIQNKEILDKYQNANSQTIQPFKAHQGNDQLIKNDSKQQQLQEINQQTYQGQNPTIQDYSQISKQRIKQAVKNIKSQLQQMQPNQLSKIQKNNKKPTKTKKSKTKVNQQDVNKIVNNIVEKSKLKQKNIIKNSGKKKQKIFIREIDRQSIEKHNKSKQKPTQVSKSKQINLHKFSQTQQLHNKHKNNLQIKKQLKQKQQPKTNNKIQNHIKSIKQIQKLKMLVGQNLTGSLQKILNKSKQKVQQNQKNISPYKQKPLIKHLKTQQNAYVSKTSNKTIQQDKHKKVKVSKDEYIKYLKNKN